MREKFRDTVLVLDEASMVSTRDQDRLIRLSNLLHVDRLVLMGDEKQLGAVEAGKPFALGRVDKRDSYLPRVLIQDCFLRSSHGSWGLIGCGVGTDRAASAA